MATPIIVADFETQLSAAIAVGATSFILTSVTDDDGVALPSGLYYFTIDNGSPQKEYLAGTLSGTTVSSVVSVSRQGSETSGAVRAHRAGASVILSDFAYKQYMDGIALVSAPDASTSAKGVVEAATQAEFDAKTAVGSTLAKLAVTPDIVRSTKFNDYVADTGIANAYVITPSPAITAYAAGQVFVFKATSANTTTSTLNVSGLGVKTIKKGVSTNLAAGDIASGQMVQVVYDGTNFILISNPSPTKTVVTGLSVNTGTTTKLMSGASTTQVIPHGLSAAPNKVHFRSAFSSSGETYQSEGYWYTGDKYSNYSVVYAEGSGSSITDVYLVSTSFLLHLSDDSTLTGRYQRCTVSVDATNITLTWTRTGTPGAATADLIWEAECLTTTTVTA